MIRYLYILPTLLSFNFITCLIHIYTLITVRYSDYSFLQAVEYIEITTKTLDKTYVDFILNKLFVRMITFILIQEQKLNFLDTRNVVYIKLLILI